MFVVDIFILTPSNYQLQNTSPLDGTEMTRILESSTSHPPVYLPARGMMTNYFLQDQQQPLPPASRAPSLRFMNEEFKRVSGEMGAVRWVLNSLNNDIQQIKIQLPSHYAAIKRTLEQTFIVLYV